MIKIGIMSKIENSYIRFIDKYHLIESPNIIYLGKREMKELLSWSRERTMFFTFHIEKEELNSDVKNKEVIGMQIIEVNEDTYMECGIK